jgi:hypothetical protein
VKSGCLAGSEQARFCVVMGFVACVLACLWSTRFVLGICTDVGHCVLFGTV